MQLKAEVTAAKGNSRERGYTVKKKLSADHPCPYCGDYLGNGYHADHIYPVSKGGRSTLKNMVNVCFKCNEKNGQLTLTAFIKLYQLDRELIEKRLEMLGKEF